MQRFLCKRVRVCGEMLAGKLLERFSVRAVRRAYLVPIHERCNARCAPTRTQETVDETVEKLKPVNSCEIVYEANFSTVSTHSLIIFTYRDKSRTNKDERTVIWQAAK